VVRNQPPDAINKRCPHCGQRKPLTAFFCNAWSGDGLSWWCIECSVQYKNEGHERPSDKRRGQSIEASMRKLAKRRICKDGK
jgi:hypothetical protein